ncbi:2,3-bisphosphoglycerate-independent phosphoglycerate mutase [candidate division KSB1 bacterium]|nr:2,3-bisphosphoglycerate-independent phosphoglycerate mutase [candidate division KSB1 bacterium]
MPLELKQLPHFKGRKGPLLLIIMDGIGLGEPNAGNAVHLARTPILDQLFQGTRVTQLKAHGTAVGLPTDDDMGNSEVGHNAIGAGRVFAQGAKRVDESLKSGALFENKVWSQIVERGKKDHTVHFLGLLSDGNVHSHIDHLFTLLRQCAREKIARVRVHALLDGRDVGERSALDYLQPTEKLLQQLSKENDVDYRIASGGGRMVTTMDRYNADWSVVERGWNAHVLGKGRAFTSAVEAVRSYYDENPKITDQYMDSFVVVDKNGEPVGTIKDGDAVVNFNFRGDRAIEITRAFEEKDLNEFEHSFVDVFYAGMMQYDGDLHIPKNFLVDPPQIDRTISQYLCAAGVTSFAISETQKFGHVTYFWNGNRSGYIDTALETYVEIPSDKIEFDQAPRMKAPEITEKTIELLRSNRYRFGRVNFANGDMVGHTGVMEAAIEAVETVDTCVGELLEIIKELDGTAIVTADHGNADVMFVEKNGKKEIKTAHTLNPVPFVIYDPKYNDEYKMAAAENPGLTNIAATLLNLLGYDKPTDYDDSLIEFK